MGKESNLLLAMIVLIVNCCFTFSTFSFYQDNGNRFLSFLSGKSNNLDIDQDGHADFMILRTDSENFRLIITPSWSPNIRKIIISSPQKVNAQLFTDGMIKESYTTLRDPKDLKVDKVISFYDYDKGKPQSKKITTWINKSSANVKIFKRDKKKWSISNEKKVKFSPIVSSDNDCYQQFIPLPRNLLPSNLGFQSLRRSDYLLTKIGLRIDKKTCPKSTWKQLDSAIDIVAKKYLPCFAKLRPNVASRLVSNLLESQNIIHCSTAIVTPGHYETSESRGHYAYTDGEYLSADITLLRLFTDYSTPEKKKVFKRSDEDLASTIFHEILHHHFSSSPLHANPEKAKNGENLLDAVWGCSMACSGYLNSVPSDAPHRYRASLSPESCNKCFETPEINATIAGLFDSEISSESIKEATCNESLFFKKYRQCQKFNSDIPCGSMQLQEYDANLRDRCTQYLSLDQSKGNKARSIETCISSLLKEKYDQCMKYNNNKICEVLQIGSFDIHIHEVCTERLKKAGGQVNLERTEKCVESLLEDTLRRCSEGQSKKLKCTLSRLKFFNHPMYKRCVEVKGGIDVYTEKHLIMLLILSLNVV